MNEGPSQTDGPNAEEKATETAPNSLIAGWAFFLGCRAGEGRRGAVAARFPKTNSKWRTDNGLRQPDPVVETRLE